MFSVTSTQTMPILATYNPNGKIAITASAIGEDLGNTFRTHIVEQKDPRFLYAIARAVTADIPNKNKDMFPLDEIKRAYTTFIGRNIFLDHNTTSVRNAVGKIIAAELREDEEGQTYVACLFKIDRELHPDIARKIENGIIDSVSMGANVNNTECSICSNIATREADFCVHQKSPSLYSNYYAINRGVEFTELSLVSVPADPSAKMHKVFDMHNGMQKVAVGEADLTTVQKSGEQPEETVTKTDTNEVPVQPQREDLPQPDTIKVEQPVKEVKGKVYQIDCSSNESADFIYNILYPYLNKGIEELIITGRGVKVFFDEQVKDPEIFVGEACSLFGLMMEKGIADQKAVASYDAFLKVQAKVEEVRFSSLLIDNEQFPLYVKYEDRVRSKGEHNVTIIIDGIKSFLGKYDDQFLKNEIADAFLAIPHVKSSQIAQSPNGEYKNHLAIKLVLDTDWSDFAPEMGQFVGIAKDVFTKAQDSKNKKKQEKKEVKDEKLLGLSDAASKKFLNAFSKETRKPTALWGIIKSGLADTTESPITVLKQNKDILTKLSDTRYNTILGAAFNSLIRNKVNDTELVDSDGNVDKEKALAIFKEVGIEDKQEFDAYANYLKSLGMEGDTGFGKFVNSVVMDKDSYINNFSGVAPKVVEESAEESVTPKEEPT